MKKTLITTDPQEELLIQVDATNNIIGPIARKVAHATSGIYYRTIYVLVKNDKDEFLFQKRSPTKDLYPDSWDLSVGGHVNFGKSYIETAARELREELGLVVKESDLFFKGEVLVKLPKNGEFFNVFEYSLKKTDKLSLSKEEIASSKWMTLSEVKESMKTNTLKWYVRPEQVIQRLY